MIKNSVNYPMKIRDLIKLLRKSYPDISEEQILCTCRHIKLLLSEWNLRVRNDILQYLYEEEICEDLSEIKAKKVKS